MNERSLAPALALITAALTAYRLWVIDLNLAATCASRVLLLDGGRLVADGVPGEVLRAGILEGVYHVKVNVCGGLLTFSRADISQA